MNKDKLPSEPRTLSLYLQTAPGTISYKFAAVTDDEYKRALAIVQQGMTDMLGKLLALGDRR